MHDSSPFIMLRLFLLPAPLFKEAGKRVIFWLNTTPPKNGFSVYYFWMGFQPVLKKCTSCPTSGRICCCVFLLICRQQSRSQQWYNAIPCNTVWFDTIQCDTIQYNAISCNTIQCHTIQWNTDIIRCDAMPCYTIQYIAIYHAIPSNTIRCNAIPCNTIRYNAMSRVRLSPKKLDYIGVA